MSWLNTVTVGEFVADLDDPGAESVTAEITGWDGAPIREGIEDAAGQDGGYDGPGLYGPRVINLDGFVRKLDPVAAQAVADLLSTLTPKSLHLFTVTKAGVGLRQAMVRVIQRPDPAWETPESFTYSMVLKAADHRRYGPAWYSGLVPLAGSVAGSGRKWPRSWPRSWGVTSTATPGTVPIPNAGLTEYRPVIRINGPAPMPKAQIVETGDWLRFKDTVPAGQFIDIDCRGRHVTFGKNATDVRWAVEQSGRWLSVAPGGATLAVTTDQVPGSGASVEVNGWEGAWD